MNKARHILAVLRHVRERDYQDNNPLLTGAEGVGAFAGEPSLAGSVPRGAGNSKVYAVLRTSI